MKITEIDFEVYANYGLKASVRIRRGLGKNARRRRYLNVSESSQRRLCGAVNDSLAGCCGTTRIFADGWEWRVPEALKR